MPKAKAHLRELLFRWTKVQLPLLKQGAPTLGKNKEKFQIGDHPSGKNREKIQIGKHDARG